MVSTGPCSGILKERKKDEICTVNTACFLRKKGGGIQGIQGLHQESQISALSHGEKR